MITLKSTLCAVLIVYGSATNAQAEELSVDHVESFKAISEVVEANCGDVQDDGRLHFLKEVAAKIETHVAELTTELRDGERTLLEPKKYYIRSLALKADDAAQKVAKVEGTIRDLRFERVIEKDAVAVYSDVPGMSGEVRQHELRQKFFDSQINKTNRRIASLKEVAQANRKKYELLSAVPESIDWKDSEVQQLTQETRAKLPTIRDLTAKYQHLGARARLCIAKADGDYKHSMEMENKYEGTHDTTALALYGKANLDGPANGGGGSAK